MTDGNYGTQMTKEEQLLHHKYGMFTQFELWKKLEDLEKENAALKEIAIAAEWGCYHELVDQYYCPSCGKYNEQGHTDSCPYRKVKL